MSILRMCGLICGVLLLVIGANSTGCVEEKVGPKVCNYEHECQENERCIYDDPSCTATSGQCKGVCTPQEPIPERTCDCSKDEDCKNFPSEGCAACRCVSQNVLRCNSDEDCIRGWYCIGEPGKGICQARSSCKEDEECPHGFECREGSCCDLQTSNCPSTCRENTPCESDVDCYFCNMRCTSKKCTFDSTDPCAGIKCINDEDCSTCNGKCAAGYCQAGSTTVCLGKTCAENNDCSACGNNCEGGTCKEKKSTTCTSTPCEQDSDCTASGLKSCIEKCCQ